MGSIEGCFFLYFCSFLFLLLLGHYVILILILSSVQGNENGRRQMETSRMVEQ